MKRVVTPHGRIRLLFSSPRRFQGRWLLRWGLIELAAYFLLAILATWPLVLRCSTSLPLGTESVATVPLFNTWTLWWNADRAAHLYRNYWQAPIFYPTDGTFAFSEPMPTTIAAAPLIWFGGFRILAYNSLVLAALALNGWFAFQVLRYLRTRWLVCLLGGAMMEMLPLVHSEFGVLQLVPLYGILWTVLALHRFARRPLLGRSLMLGTAFAFTYLTCAYYGLFLSILLLLGSAWLFGRRLRQSGTWWRLAVGGIFALSLISPVVATQVMTIRAHDLRRPHDWMNRLSADFEDYAATPWPSWFEPDSMARWRERCRFRLSPGILKIALAGIGTVMGLRWRRYRKWTAFCVTMAVAALLLSQGPKLAIFGWSPYAWLTGWYPGMAQARNVYRFAVFVQLACVLLAATGLQAIAGRRHAGSYRSIATACVGLLALTEVLPGLQNLYAVPALESQIGWIDWLRQETPADAAIAVIPFPEGTSAKAYEQTALDMYWGSFHHRRMVNGYSGFFPESYRRTKALMADFPSAEAIERLKELAVAYCVVDRRTVPREFIPKEELVWIFGDDTAGVDVYRLESPGQPAKHASPSTGGRGF
ncbi:MAG: hypothetical protein JJ992_05370 [Planctomycetes bacterium]|nr:hypothetical protein [Planctomycetota bacterium]